MITEKSVMFDFFDKKDNIIVKKYQDTILDIADKIFNSFGISKDVALVLADKLLIGGLKKEFIIQYTEHDRIIQYTSGGYYIKISALKLRKLENTLRELKNEGLQIREGLVCKLYLPNREEPVLVLQGRKRKIAGREFWLFSVRKSDYEKYSDERFTMVIESADERIQEISKMVMEFINEFRELSKNKETSVDELKESTRVRLSDIVLERARRYKKKYLRPARRGRKKKSTQQRPASDPAPAPQPGGNEQAREVVVEKVEQVEQVAEEREPPAEKKTEASQAEQGKRRHVDREYYEKLRKELDEFIDWLTVKRLKDDYGIEHIKSFVEFKEAVNRDELSNGAEKLIKDIPMVRSHVRKFIDFLEENNYKIGKESIFKFFNSLEKRYLTKDTLSRYKTHLKQFINYLGDYESYIFISNIKTNGKKGKKGQGHFYTPEQMETILKQIAGHPNLSEKEKDELIGLISLMYVSGLRYSEAMRLQVKDFDFENRIGIVRRTKAKKGYARPIFITGAVKDYLIALIKKYNKKPNDLLFDRSIRFFRQPHKVRITEYLKEVGIELNVSGLRDSYATLFEKYSLETEIDIESLTAGHSAKIRSRHYNQVKTKFEEIFDNRSLYTEEYEFVILLRRQYDVVMKKILKNKMIPPVQLNP